MAPSTTGTAQVKLPSDKPSTGRIRAMVPRRLRQWRSRSNSKTQAPARRNLSMFLREWHKRAGIAAFIFMIWLGASGFLINQSSAWGYDTIRIDWSWVTGLYGLKASPPHEGFIAGDAWLAKSGDVVALNGEELSFSIPAPLGIVASDAAGLPLLFIATREALYAVTPEGKLYERMMSPIIPVKELVRLGTRGTAIVIEGRDGLHASADGGLSWTTPEDDAVAWSEPKTLTEPQREELAPFSRPTMSLEQTLLDLHSGRIFGDVGVWVVNIVGFMAIFLGISGIWMTWRISRQRSRRGA
jgi:hypothetical protein